MLVQDEVFLFLLLYIGSGLCALAGVTEITVKLLDDENFRTLSEGYIRLKGVDTLSDVSSPTTEKVKIIESTQPNQVSYTPDFPTGTTQLIVKARRDQYSLNLNVERIIPNAILNAVFLTGSTVGVNEILSSLHTSIRVIYKSSEGKTTEVAVQVRKPGSTTSDFLPLWQAYDWLLTKNLPSDVQLMPDQCQKISEPCRSRLSFVDGHQTVQQADVQLGSSDNFQGFNLIWEAQTIEQMHSERCGPWTCLNGGVCDPKFSGDGYKCICPTTPNAPKGPRCEYSSRSFDNTESSSLVSTRHRIGDIPYLAESLDLSFEFTGTMQRSGSLLALIDSKNIPVIAVSRSADSNAIMIEGSLLVSGPVNMNMAFSADLWSIAHILVNKDNIIAVICRQDSKSECSQQMTPNRAGIPARSEFRLFSLEIGKSFKGCIQSVSVNGYSVDLEGAREIGDASKIAHFCHHQDGACGKKASSGYACGDHSVCYGALSYGTEKSMSCSCKCIRPKRKVVETITDSSVCRPGNSKCNKDAPVLKTRKKDEAIWSLNGGRSLPMPSKDTVSLELELQTKHDYSNVPKVLTAKMINSKGTQDMTLDLKIKGGMLSLCITVSVPDCRNFRPIKVNNKEWHSVSASIKGSLLILTINGVSSTHALGRGVIDLKAVDLSAAIPDSNLRNVRVSGIYMSTNNDNDRSEDPNGDYVMLSFASEVAEVNVKLPDDDSFREHGLVSFSINKVETIESVNSQIPNKFNIDKTTSPHRISFKPDLLPGPTQLTVKSGSSYYTVNLKVEKILPTAILNAVFITGLTSSVNDMLKSLKSSIRLISKMPGNDASTTDAAVQVRNPESTSDFLSLWEAYDWLLIETKKLSSNVQLMPEKCEGRSEPCRSRLAFIGGQAAVQQASVQLGSSDNFLGFKLIWESQTLGQMHAEPCGPATCLNGGVCDSKLKGVGFRCTCPTLPNIPWGPRCEYPTRSYDNAESSSPVSTRHRMGDIPYSSESLELSFEFSGTMQRAASMLALIDAKSSPLIGVSSSASTNTIMIDGSLVNSGPINMNMTFSADLWSTAHIVVNRNSITAVICRTGSMSQCSQKTASNMAGIPTRNDFRHISLEIGKSLKGCVQSVKINGFSVDLAAGKHVGDASKATKFCNHQDGACGKKAASSGYSCGDHSVCYGALSYGTEKSLSCSCKCIGSKRKVVETIRDSGVCRPENAACIKEAPILRTRANDEIKWSLNGDRSLPMPSKDSVSLELEFQTTQSHVPNVLTANLVNTRGAQDTKLDLKITEGFLSFCITTSVPECRKFPPIKVDDNQWHSVSASIKGNLLILTVDGVTSTHVLSSGVSDLKAVDLSAAIPDSNLRNVRASDIYMSTNNNNDRSEDPNGDFVTIKFASDVTTRTTTRTTTTTTKTTTTTTTTTTEMPTTLSGFNIIKHTAVPPPAKSTSMLIWIIIAVCAAVLVGIIAAVLIFF